MFPSFDSTPPLPLMNVVEPVDDVKEGEDGGKDHPGPLVDRVDVGQVGDVDLQLRGASAEATLLLLQAAGAVVVARQSGASILQGGAVVGQHGTAGVAETPGEIGRTHLVLQLHGRESDVIRIHLERRHTAGLETCI